MTIAFTQPVLHRHYDFAASLQSALSVSDVERTYLDRIDGLIPARAHALYRLDPDTGSPVAVASEVSTDFVDEYEEFGRADAPGPRFARPRDRADYYYYHSMEVPVLVEGVQCATLTFARGAEDPPFGVEELRSAHRIGEQVGPALERALRYEDTRRRTSLLEAAFDHLPFAVVVTNLDANVLFSNRDAAGKIAVKDGDEKEIATPAHDALREAMSKFRRHNKRVSVTAVDDSAAEERVIVKSIRMGPRSDTSVSVFYSDTRNSDSRLPVWKVLSPREQEIAEFVSRGLTTKQIAELAFVTENTVKQHLKRIFTKVDVRNRAELLQRIWSSAEAEPSAEEN